MEDDLGEQLQLYCHALSDHGDGTGTFVYLKLCFSSVSCLSAISLHCSEILIFFPLQQESSCCFWPQSLEEKSIFGNITVCLKRVSNEAS